MGLSKEWDIHTRVSRAFDEYADLVQCRVRVPKLIDYTLGQFTPENLELWSRFPEPHNQPGEVGWMERILPLPKVVRRALVELSIESHPHPSLVKSQNSEQLIKRVLDKTDNKHCLGRVYLGRTKPRTPLPPPTDDRFSLRNLPLYLDTLRRLDLNINDLATQMGRAFAIMHWGAGINGDDVEFVLGTSLVEDPQAQAGTQLRQVNMFLLDFCQCKDIDEGLFWWSQRSC